MTGGFALAAKWVGFQTVAFVEIEPYAQEIIKKNFGAVMAQSNSCGSWSSNRNTLHQGRATGADRGAGLQKDAIGENGPTISDDWAASTLFGDIRTFDGTRYRGATLLTGGFSCQPFSQAGKRRGKEDDRYLWPEMLRVISEAKPRWIVAENVAGLLSVVEPGSLSSVEIKEIELFQSSDDYAVNEIIQRVHRRIIATIIQDLEKIGYELPRLADGTPIVLCVPACGAGAFHKRDRVWIVGHAEGRTISGKQQRTDGMGQETASKRQADNHQINGSSQDVADAADDGQQRTQWAVSQNRNASRRLDIGDGCQWLPEPDVGRVAHGIPNRVDRLKGLGNAIVPQVAYQIIKGIAELENAALR